MNIPKIALAVTYDLSRQRKRQERAVLLALRKAVLAWEAEAKLSTSLEGHVVTGRYRASINRNTQDGAQRQSAPSSRASDGIHLEKKYNQIEAGSNVEYAIYLEKRYHIFQRALDKARDRMIQSFSREVIKHL